MSAYIEEYAQKMTELRKLVRTRRDFEAAIQLALELHASTHSGEVSGSAEPTYFDQLINGLQPGDFRVMPTEKDETIAWQVWHIARIEDLVANLLIAESPQVFTSAWAEKLGVPVKDTGNAMTDAEIMAFSKQVDVEALLGYWGAVGRRTREVIKALAPADMKRKPRPEALAKLVEEGGLLAVEGSLWLKDFWGRHTVAGLLILPLTRHHVIHLPDSYRIKAFLQDPASPAPFLV